MERIKLNLIPSGVAPIVHLSQYDDGRKFGIDLFEGESVYVLDGTETLTVNSRKPDGHVVTLSVTNTGTSSLDVDTVEQLTAVHGVSYAKLKIEKGSVTIATLPFLIDVSRDPLENGDPSESFVQNLQTQIAEAVSEQYDSSNVIFDDEPTENHGDGYAVNSAGLKAYIPKNIDNLDDVEIDNPSSNQALVWDAENNRWTNGEVSTVGSIDDLDDVDTTGKATGDSLRYDGNEWVAKPTTIALTQAEYDALALSGDLQNNTHYVITDAPNLNPTASDIEYSSGVSVKQAIDSKQATLTNQVVTLTPNTSILGSNFTGACYQYGKVVCLFVQTANPTSEVAYESIFLTGLPKPVYASGNNRVSLTDRATNKPYRFRITDSGQLQEWYNSSGKIPSGADLYGTIVYLAE